MLTAYSACTSPVVVWWSLRWNLSVAYCRRNSCVCCLLMTIDGCWSMLCGSRVHASVVAVSAVYGFVGHCSWIYYQCSVFNQNDKYMLLYVGIRLYWIWQSRRVVCRLLCSAPISFGLSGKGQTVSIRKLTAVVVLACIYCFECRSR